MNEAISGVLDRLGIDFPISVDLHVTVITPPTRPYQLRVHLRPTAAAGSLNHFIMTGIYHCIWVHMAAQRPPLAGRDR